MEWDRGSPLRLSEALQSPLEWPEETPEPERKLLEEQRAFLLRLRELARGLLGSEYWELVSLVLIDGLETAKGALESETIDDRSFRVKQGEAKAYLSAYNLFVSMSNDASEEKNG
jgi:hypothetical protein